jgi:50S ribosomal subunit-associated GTPase HflX
VDATLEDMGVAHKPRIVMYNKVDALSEVCMYGESTSTYQFVALPD